MKKLYRKGTVHPSPPVISDHLAFLPATILTLTAALSQEDREVLAYIICCSNINTSFSNFSGPRKIHQKSSGGGSSSKSATDHPPLFNCDCFRCYTSYWVRWDSSPNRQLIHEIIDAYEDGLAQSKGGRNNRKERRKKNNNGSGEMKRSEMVSDSVVESSDQDGGGSGGGSGGGGEGGDELEKGSVRRLVSFIGEKIWNAWSQ